MRELHSTCPLCKHDQHKVLARRGKFGFPATNVVCLSCGFVFQNPPQVATEIEQLYRRSRYVVRNYGSDINATFDNMCRVSPSRLGFLRKHGVLRLNLRVLDVGAGCGAFAHALNAEGCRVTCVEADPEACRFIRERLGLRVHEGMFENLVLENGRFDLVTLVSVFEHVANPEFFLDKVARLLVDGGLVFIEVPNVLRMYTDERHWFDYFDVGHLYSFSRNSLQRMLVAGGFETVDIRETCPTGHFQSLSALARPRRGDGSSTDAVAFDSARHAVRVVRYTRFVHKLRWVRDHKGLIADRLLQKLFGERIARRMNSCARQLLGRESS